MPVMVGASAVRLRKTSAPPLGLALGADGGGTAFGFRSQAILFCSGHILNALALDFRALENSGDQLFFMTQDFGLLHLDLAFLLHLLHLHLLDRNNIV